MLKDEKCTCVSMHCVPNQCAQSVFTMYRLCEECNPDYFSIG